MICLALIGEYANFRIKSISVVFSFKLNFCRHAAIKCDIGDMRLITDICDCHAEMLICINFL